MTSTPESTRTTEAEPTPEFAESTAEADPTAESEAEPKDDSTAESADVPAAAVIDESVARELALAALGEITPESTIGEHIDASVAEDGVLTLRFANRMPGYPGWFWTVGLAQVEGSAPTVLEVELTPGEGSLTAPEWLPWAERLAEYQAAQAALAAEGLAVDDLDMSAEDDDEDEDLDDVEDIDAVDFDNDGSPILHSGDVDGVDIDVLSDDAIDDDDESDDDDDDSDDDDESDDDDDDSDDDEDDSDDDESDDDDDEDDSDDDESDDDEDESDEDESAS